MANKHLKRRTAEAALDFVEAGMVVPKSGKIIAVLFWYFIHHYNASLRTAEAV